MDMGKIGRRRGAIAMVSADSHPSQSLDSTLNFLAISFKRGG